MLATFVFRDHMVDGQPASVRTAVLASVIIASENLSLAQANPGAGSFYHVAKPYNRGPRIVFPNRMNETASIQQHLRFAHEDKPHCSFCGADV
jgi:hypothetical protein